MSRATSCMTKSLPALTAGGRAGLDQSVLPTSVTSERESNYVGRDVTVKGRTAKRCMTSTTLSMFFAAIDGSAL